MHLLGHDMKMTVTSPTGKTRDLISIPDWDPAWQSCYHFQKPIPITRGSVVKVVAHYDNSALAEPELAPEAGEMGPRGVRRDVRGVHRRGQGRPGSHPPRSNDDLGDILCRQRMRIMMEKWPGRRDRAGTRGYCVSFQGVGRVRVVL